MMPNKIILYNFVFNDKMKSFLIIYNGCSLVFRNKK